MGRKIPGRKHKGVKDPEKQRAERFAKIKDKVNVAPSNPDDQQIPKSLSKLMDIRDKIKQGLFGKKKKRDDNSANKQRFVKGREEKPIPKFEQLPGETERDFKRRMNRICSEFVREAAFEDKYNVDIKRNEEGEVEGVTKRSKDELELLVQKLQKEKKSKSKVKGKKKKNSKDEQQPRLTKSQKWALKKSEKKKKKQSEKNQDYHLMPQKEQVKFGEIAHAPPTLSVPKKIEKAGGAPRPGQKQLLLKSMLPNGANHKSMKNTTDKQRTTFKKGGVSEPSKTLNKKGKRRDLPHALRRQLDKQQKEIIEAYKLLKSKKHSE